jgi:signal transduction histidine kinase
MGLRSRLILSFIAVIFLCLVMVAITLTAQSGDVLGRVAAARLTDLSAPLYIQARNFLRSQDTLDQGWPNIEEQAVATGVRIFLCDSNGKVLRRTTNAENITALPQSIFARRFGPAGRILRGSFEGQDGKAYIYAAYSLANIAKFKDSNIDWLVIAAPPSAASTFASELLRSFLLAGLVALIVSIVIAVLLARSVYEPIERVKKASAEMARGKYDQEVLVEGPREVRELAASFNEMSKQVKNSEQTLKDFVADVSHELRTPLTSISGFAQAIRDGTAQDKESVDKSAGIIEEESKRMIRLVNNLLELSKLESGQLEMKKEPVDLEEVIQQCREIFVMRAEEKSIFLVIDLEPLPQVMGDIDRLEQVFNNLLDNAIKHTPRGGTVTVRGRHNNFETVEISVIDTGPGISKEKLPHVFERFSHGEEPSGRPSTGLGLAISRRIVLSHGGDIKVNSQPVKGAELTVRLPAMDGTTGKTTVRKVKA